MALEKEKLKQTLRAARELVSRSGGQPAAPSPAETSGASPGTPSRFGGEPVYRSRIPPAVPGEAKALVILCSSNLFLRHCQDFLADGLHLTEYDLVAVPGGVQWLALPDILPKHHKVARWVAEFLIREHRLRRVVCIAHQDCSAYENQGTLGALAHLITGKTVFEHQLDQLRRVGRELTELFGVEVDLYYAATEGGTVVFHRVDPEAGRQGSASQ